LTNSTVARSIRYWDRSSQSFQGKLLSCHVGQMPPIHRAHFTSSCRSPAPVWLYTSTPLKPHGDSSAHSTLTTKPSLDRSRTLSVVDSHGSKLALRLILTNSQRR